MSKMGLVVVYSLCRKTAEFGAENCGAYSNTAESSGSPSAAVGHFSDNTVTKVTYRRLCLYCHKAVSRGLGPYWHKPEWWRNCSEAVIDGVGRGEVLRLVT